MDRSEEEEEGGEEVEGSRDAAVCHQQAGFLELLTGMLATLRLSRRRWWT